MPIPRSIADMKNSAHLVATLQRQVQNPQQSVPGRAQLPRTFHVYLELTMQAKHDQVIAGYCKSVGVEARKQDGTQVRHAKNATAPGVLAGFYAQKARLAADVVSGQMLSKWHNQSVPGQAVFKPEVRVDAKVQSQPQSDQHRYEISYWYGGQDIYVLFHVYPNS